ncbi:Ferrichrome-iron receptor [Nitrospira sp. KM1]|uniref:TonB-dependent siderophore receptor n=1 Tax=Nitrospira sp. KM1 TaxID=1936990 RepID=UPI0013A74A8B|nr:TonB-dependent receptor [Nitrospira sp. KM1]BCA56564.1 Ferrichrome-iron receptor [Nitrospira sp. KM1]
MNRWMLCAGVLLVCALAVVGGPEYVLAEPMDFEIAAKPLAGALAEFAAKTNLQVLYSGELTKGLNTNGVHGLHEPEEALKILLKDSGLTYRFTDAETITLERDGSANALPAAGIAGAAGVAATMESTPSGQGSQKPVKVPEILVKEVRERDNDTKSYVAEEASTATRSNTPVRDVPQSIQVITRKVIEEQRTFRLQDSLENVSGLVTNRSSQNLNDSFLIRGFQVNNVYRNGLIDPSNILNGTDSYNIQRLEVLKGPAAVLYGQGDPGGIVNLITKKPLPDPYYSINATFGNYNFYRSEIEATGALSPGKTLLYRLNVVGQDAGSFVDYVRRDLVGIAPSFTWLMNNRTTLTVEADYFRRWMPRYSGVPALGTVLPNINGALPRSRNASLGDFEKDTRQQTRVGYDLTYQFNNDWAVRNAYRYTVFERTELVTANPGVLQADERTLTRFGQEGTWQRHFHNMFTNLTGRFKLLEMEHNLLAGFELRQDKTDPTEGVSRTAPNIDLYAPNYSQGLGPITAPFLLKDDSKMAGVYLQDMIALLPNLKFMGGVRFDYVHQSINPTSSTQDTSDDTAVSPRLGLVYQPIEPVSLYTSWTRGFLPNTPSVFNPTGQLFKPERSTQYEIGIKSFFLDNRVSTTLAWYHLTRENLLTPDPFNPLAQVQTGEQRSQGVEFDVAATLTSGWNVIASYAYTDAEVTQDNDPTLVNKRLAFVPYNKATLWSTYYFQEGVLQGFGVGGGVFGYSSRNASLFGPQLNVPGFVRVDAALYYNHDVHSGNWLHAKQVNLALNFRNLFDQGYIESAFNSTTRLFYGEPRTVLATVGLKF